jgi:hypothetical protein
MNPLPFGEYGFSISIYVLSIMFMLSGMVLGIGYALNDRRLKEFGRKELYQSIVNGVLIGSLLMLFANGGIITQLINSLTVSNGTILHCSEMLSVNKALCLAYDYLVGEQQYTFYGRVHSSVLSEVTGLITALLGLSAVLGAIAGIKINLVIITLSFGSVVNPLIYELQYIVKTLSAIAISILVQSAVLMVISVSTLTVLLPSGMILRTFYPTRRLGGFLTALSIGLYVVLPLSYVLNATILNQYSSNVNATELNQITLSAQGIKDNIISSNRFANETGGFGVIEGLSNSMYSLANSVDSTVNLVLSNVSEFIMYAFITPLFSLIVTGISIRELAELMGSEAFFGKFNIL